MTEEDGVRGGNGCRRSAALLLSLDHDLPAERAVHRSQEVSTCPASQPTLQACGGSRARRPRTEPLLSPPAPRAGSTLSPPEAPAALAARGLRRQLLCPVCCEARPEALSPGPGFLPLW